MEDESAGGRACFENSALLERGVGIETSVFRGFLESWPSGKAPALNTGVGRKALAGSSPALSFYHLRFRDGCTGTRSGE